MTRLDEGRSIGVLESGSHRFAAGEGSGEVNPVILVRGKRSLDLEGDGSSLDAGGHLEAVQLTGSVPLGDDAVGGLAGGGITVHLDELHRGGIRHLHAHADGVLDGDGSAVGVVVLQPGATEDDAPVDGLRSGADSGGPLDRPGARGERHDPGSDDIFAPGVLEHMVLSVDDEGAAGPGRDPVRHQLCPERPQDVCTAPHRVVQGARDEAGLDIAVTDLSRTHHEGFDDLPLGVPRVAVHERLRHGNGKGVPRLWVGCRGIEGNVQKKEVSPDKLSSGSWHGVPGLGDMGERHRPECDSAVLLGVRHCTLRVGTHHSQHERSQHRNEASPRRHLSDIGHNFPSWTCNPGKPPAKHNHWSA